MIKCGEFSVLWPDSPKLTVLLASEFSLLFSIISSSHFGGSTKRYIASISVISEAGLISVSLVYANLL